jgi:hypothetical protein
LPWIDEETRAMESVASVDTKVGAILREETFATVPPRGWKQDASPKAGAGSIRADNGLVLIIPANVHAWHETELPRGTTGVSAAVWQDPQDDAQLWDPGFAVIWSSGDTLKVSRRRDGRIAVARNGAETFPASLAQKEEVTLAIHWDEKEVRVVAGGPAMQGIDEVVAKFPRSEFAGNPTAARIGKMSAKADAADHTEAGPVGYTRFAWFRIHGDPGQ